MKTALSLLTVATLVLTGCATTQTVEPLSQPQQASSIAADRIGSALLGTRVDLADIDTELGSEVFVHSEYTAASGNVCRRFNNEDSQFMRVACRSSSDSWYLQRSLNPEDFSSGPRLMSETTLPAIRVLRSLNGSSDSDIVSPDGTESGSMVDTADPVEVIVSDVNDVTEHSLEAGETLWSFSVRTTGSGANWQQIAALNGIDDARQVESGQTLLVPSDLIR